MKIKVDCYLEKLGTDFTGVVIDDNRDVAYYVDGKLHREGGPAVECANGHKAWFLHGECHREDGVAIEHVNGEKQWFYHGECISYDRDFTLEDFQKAILKLQ